MTKQEFIEFSLEDEYAIDLLLDLIKYHNEKYLPFFQWDFMKKMIIENNITTLYIINVLRQFKAIDIKVNIYSGSEFFTFICEMANCGYNEGHVVSQYLHCL